MRDLTFTLTTDERGELGRLFEDPGFVTLIEKHPAYDSDSTLARLCLRLGAFEYDGAGQWAVTDAPIWAVKRALRLLDEAKDLTPKPKPAAKPKAKPKAKPAAARAHAAPAAAGTKKALAAAKPKSKPKAPVTKPVTGGGPLDDDPDDL